jgi:hypothetical protein
LIASKIEDIFPAQSNDLIQLSEHLFTQNALEQTPLFYLMQFMSIHEQTPKSKLLGKYIPEIAHKYEAFFGAAPSLITSIATMVARILNDEHPRSRELAGHTMCRQKDESRFR